MRGKPRVATVTVMAASTCWGEASARCARTAVRKASDGGPATHTGHPAGGRYVSGQVSWLTDQRVCPAFPGFRNPSDTDGQTLPAYSWGGCPGIHRLPPCSHADT